MKDLQAALESNAFRSILALTAICVSICVYLLNRKRKALSYQITRNDQLFRIDEQLKKNLQITVDGRPAQDISLVLIDIENTGNEPIKREDFERPLTFIFANDAEVISARVLRTQPGDLDARLTTKEATVSLSPILLNSGDSASIELVLTSAAGFITHTARIVGVSKVRALTGTRGMRAIIQAPLVLSIATMAFASGTLLIPALRVPVFGTLLYAANLVSLLTFMVAIYFPKKGR